MDDADVGATADANEYTINQTIFEPDNLNGVPGMLLGTQYKTREEAVLAASMPEVSAATLALLWPGSADAGGTIDWDGTRRIAEADFHDYDLAVDGLSNTFHFLADSAINQGNIVYAANDAGMMTPRGEFHSKWSADALDASPHRIVVAALGS